MKKARLDQHGSQVRLRRGVPQLSRRAEVPSRLRGPLCAGPREQQQTELAVRGSAPGAAEPAVELRGRSGFAGGQAPNVRGQGLPAAEVIWVVEGRARLLGRGRCGCPGSGPRRRLLALGAQIAVEVIEVIEVVEVVEVLGSTPSGLLQVDLGCGPCRHRPGWPLLLDVQVFLAVVQVLLRSPGPRLEPLRRLRGGLATPALAERLQDGLGLRRAPGAAELSQGARDVLQDLPGGLVCGRGGSAEGPEGVA